ncbi:MAG: glycosyltransferase [Burkholderiaceae bacterium]
MARTLSSFARVIVVDNASDDDTVAQLAARIPQAQVIASPVNLGFGVANNRALDAVDTPYALLLNPDCHIEPEAVAQLVATADAWPEAAIVAPQLLDAQGRPELNYGWLRWHWASRTAAAQGPLCVGHACAAAWLLRCDDRAWRFDPGFFLYYEDEDLCARAQAARAGGGVFPPFFFFFTMTIFWGRGRGRRPRLSSSSRPQRPCMPTAGRCEAARLRVPNGCGVTTTAAPKCAFSASTVA